MIEHFLAWSSKAFRKPWLIVIAAVVVTILLAFGIPRLKFDNDIKAMIPKTNHYRLVHDYYEDENRFGASDTIFVAVETADIYSEKNLTYIKALKDEIEGLNNTLPGQDMAELLGLSLDEGNKVIAALRSVGINEDNYKDTLVPLITSAEKLTQSFFWDKSFATKVAAAAAKIEPLKLYRYYENPIDKIQSLVDADYIANENDALVTKKLVDGENVTPENIAGLKERVASWEIYKDALVSSDGKMSTILVKPTSKEPDIKGFLDQAIEKIIKDKADSAYTIYLDGEPIVSAMLSRSMATDVKLLLPIVVVVVLLILYLCFRTILGVIYPAAIILMSVVATMGLMGFFNMPLSIVSTTTPVLLVAIISAYGIHQMNHYLRDPDTNKLGIFEHNMKSVGLAIALSGITVMVGFGALAIEDFVPIKNFGIGTAIGDFLGTIGALYVLPSLILISRRPKKAFKAESTAGWVSGILRGFIKLNKKHSGLVVIAAIAMAAVFFVGTFGIKTELNNVSFFKKDSAIRKADDYLNKKLAGTMVLNLNFDTDLSEPYARDAASASSETVEATTPAILNKIDSFSGEVQREFPYVKKIVSFDPILKKMNQEMNGGNPKYYTIPQDKDLISQYLLIFNGDVKSYLSPNHDKLRVSITMKRVPIEEIEKVHTYCVNYFSNDFLKDNHLQLSITGAAELYNVANILLVDGMIRSIACCIVIVFCLLLFVLRDFRMSLIAITPIFVTLLINFGMLGFFNIPLNIGTAIVSSVAIGIGVDYSIHFITWYRSELRKKPDIEEAIANTIMYKGRAILYNMFVIVGGFLVLTVSQFVLLIQFGFLTAICMLTTAFGALAVVPAIIRLLAKRNFRFLYLGTEEGGKSA